MEGGPSDFPQGFPCPVVLWILLCGLRFRLRAFHPLWTAFPKPFGYPFPITFAVLNPEMHAFRFGLFPFRSPLLWKSTGTMFLFFLFLRLLRCFSSPGSLPYVMDWRMDTWNGPCRFPHSEIPGSMGICPSPKLIAAYHVFHRLSVPWASALRSLYLDHELLLSFPQQ